MGEDVAIPEAQDPESIRSQKSIPTFIVAHLLDMLAAIQLDDDQSFQAGKVANVRTDRMLAAELEAAELTSLQVPPKQSFGIRRIFAEFASVS